MKRILLLLAAVCGATALTGCVIAPVEPVAVRGGYYHSPPPRAWRDNDGDGVPNRYDRRPNDPYRY
ncbi:hypothetical protein [Ramlibacter humi]|uniref:Lipoprotein n=1 Tax=Ramlibacter humi TaxID=2530451 RepID=A0A4Z0CBK8_9BURK|nr:hypothetical protein [Ramlibacter humi]TFZ07808.1 hypothetical protein EZ216_01180 [Ramlibacter humi]